MRRKSILAVEIHHYRPTMSNSTLLMAASNSISKYGFIPVEFTQAAHSLTADVEAA
jgi:hypothetical protein